MKKFLVLNLAYQPVNPAHFGFAVDDVEDGNTHLPNSFLMTEDKAKEFAEHMASVQAVPNQKFHLVEVKGTVKTKVPVIWE